MSPLNALIRDPVRVRLIGVGNGLRRPRPPNRACGSPAHGSPVGGFHIEIGSLTHGLQNRVNTPCAAKKALAIASSDVVTLRRQHALTPHRSFHARPISAACLCASRSHLDTGGALLSLCLSVEFTYPPSCLPPLGAVLLSALLAAYHRCGTMKALTPAPLTDGPGLPAYYATPSCRSISNHVGCLVIAYHHASVTSVFRTSPWNRRLVAAPRRIEFVCLRTDTSPPVALHAA